jgi:hypothetical protein
MEEGRWKQKQLQVTGYRSQGAGFKLQRQDGREKMEAKTVSSCRLQGTIKRGEGSNNVLYLRYPIYDIRFTIYGFSTLNHPCKKGFANCN